MEMGCAYHFSKLTLPKTQTLQLDANIHSVQLCDPKMGFRASHFKLSDLPLETTMFFHDLQDTQIAT